MAYEKKNGEFTLSKNDKGDNPKRPDYKGSGLALDGTPVWVSGWVKDGSKGKFLSCTMQPKDAAPAAEKKPASKVAALEDDIPF